MMRTGLLLKYNGDVCLGKYRNGKVESFRGLNNPDAFQSLKNNCIAVVEWSEHKKQVNIKELQRIYLDFDNIDDLFQNDGIFDLAEQLWNDVVKVSYSKND